MRPPTIKIMGSPRRTQVLALLALLGESYPTEIARLLDGRLYSIQTIVDSLECEGILASRLMGRVRLVSLDPRYFAFRQLKDLLLRIAEAEPQLRKAAERRRSRPRRKGKAL